MRASIVVPTYKEESYLPRTLKALTLQTIIKDCEILLVDFNPDNSLYTRQVSQEFYEKYQIPIKVHDVFRRGIAFARNEGILQSKAPIFCNLDADSRYDTKNALERMVQPLESNYLGYMMTVCDNQFDYLQVPEARLQDMELPQRVLTGINKAQRMGMPILEPGSCFRKDAYMEVGGFNDIDRWELSTMALRFLWKFPRGVRHIEAVSVIVSPRRAMKLHELGMDTLNYAQAIRGNKVVNV